MLNKPSLPTRRVLLWIAFAGLVLGIVLYWEQLLVVFKTISTVLRPVLAAIVIAFFVNLPMRLYERGLLKLMRKAEFKHKEGLCRGLAMLLAFLSFVAVLVLASSLLYPQLRDSVKLLISNLPEYEQNLVEWGQTYLPEMELESRITEAYTQLVKNFPDKISTIVPQLFSFTSSAASAVTDSVLALMLSFYLLVSKDKLVRQTKSILTTYVPRIAKHVLPVATLLNDKFRRFLGGQCTEAIILGMLCFIGMSILGLPYAPLVSTLMGVTAVVPIFGAIVGALISAFIILMDNPLQALIFLVFITTLQQVEGNLIFPRVVGDSIGLSGLWVLLAVIIGGGLWGIPGIFIGIPVMSVIHDLVREDMKRRREAKQRI